MATATKRAHKHFQLDAAKLKRAKKVLGARTDTETVERALDIAIEENERDRQAFAAHERFFKSGIKLRDVYGVLE